MEKELLRFSTTGSVDDGKSTLIGRLLFETRAIFEDQFAAIEKTSRRRGQGETDLSLLLDGLAAEREQGITIDVAWRYFATPKRRFVIADTPGHEQYTRNMITGASQAQLAIILIDARRGVQIQSKRHGFLLSLLQVPHLIVAVNKMDLVNYAEDVFQAIVAEYAGFSSKLEIRDISYLPVSALAGDNITRRSENMPWYQGPTLLHSLENVEIGADRNLIDFRFPVQYVLRPNQNFRGYAGKVASGLIRPGENVAVLPSGQTAHIEKIHSFDGELDQAAIGESVTLTLDRELDISRGDMLVRPHNLPLVGSALDAMLCWLDDSPLDPERTYLLKHGTRTVRAHLQTISYLIDVNTLARRPAESFALNEIGRVEIQTAQPLAFDPFRENPATGRFILIDPDHCRTVAAGMIRGPVRHLADVIQTVDSHGASPPGGQAPAGAPNISPIHQVIAPREWEERNGHRGAVLWMTGLSGSGKSTIADLLVRRLFEQGRRVIGLDGDQLRHGLCSDLGFSPAERAENVRRAAEVARLFLDQGNLVVASFVSPYRSDRALVRERIPAQGFFEVFVDTPLEVCQARDPKGLYRKAAAGEIPGFTGLSAPYEPPQRPEIHLRTLELSVEQAVTELLTRLRASGILP